MAELLRKDGGRVTAFQDAVAFDFAFHGQNGIIYNIGEKCEIDTTVQNKVTIKSGMLVLQGRQVALTGNDTLVLETPAGNTYKVLVYLEINMAANTATIKKFEQTIDYPVVPVSDDLNADLTGKAYLGLYTLDNTDSGATNVKQIAYVVRPSGTRVIFSSDTGVTGVSGTLFEEGHLYLMNIKGTYHTIGEYRIPALVPGSKPSDPIKVYEINDPNYSQSIQFVFHNHYTEGRSEDAFLGYSDTRSLGSRGSAFVSARYSHYKAENKNIFGAMETVQNNTVYISSGSDYQDAKIYSVIDLGLEGGQNV